MHGVGASSAQSGNFLGEVEVKNGLTGQPDFVGANSLESMMSFVLSKKKNDPMRVQILSELKHIQQRSQLSSEGYSGKIRGSQSVEIQLSTIKSMRKQVGDPSFDAERAEIKKALKAHQNYEQSIAELTVDALVLYASDPKSMKRVAPSTAHLVRETFKQAGNKKIQLYSHPLAMVLAAVAAIIAASQGGEEEELPDGALSPMPGALSA
tara:strand:- start:958 stop:1584 length:627 start_codon:yes stop_codon:yes gene_type:complete